MKWLVDTMGIDELRERIFKERKFLIAATPYPGGIPPIVQERGDAPAGVGTSTPPAIGPGVAGRAARASTRSTAGSSPTSCAAAPTARSAPTRTAGSATSRPSSSAALAGIQRDFDARRSRITNRQNFVLRGLTEDQLRDAPRAPRRRSTWPSRAPSSPATSSPAPAPTPATSRSRSRAASPPTSTARSTRPVSPRSAACGSTSPAARTRCGQHHISDIGFFGLERRAHGRAAPGYQMLLGGRVGDMEIAFGEKATKLPAKRARRGGRAGRRPVQRRARGGRDVRRRGSPASGGAASVGDDAQGPRRVPRRPTTAPTSTSTSTRPARTWPTSATASARHDALRCPPRRTAPIPSAPRPARARRDLAALERKPASAAIEWAVEEFGDGLVLAASFQDCVLIDLAIAGRTRASRSCSSTRSTTSPRRSGTSSRSAQRYDLNLTVVEPEVDPDDRWHTTPTSAAALRKVEPLARALARQGGLDDRAAPRRGADAGAARRSSPSTSAAAS